jgi:hypothetical protein
METVLRHVRTLDQEDRSALERVVGQSLGESQQLVIQVTGDSPNQPTNGEPVQAGQLPDWCCVYDGLTDREIEELNQSIVRLSGRRDVK